MQPLVQQQVEVPELVALEVLVQVRSSFVLPFFPPYQNKELRV